MTELQKLRAAVATRTAEVQVSDNEAGEMLKLRAQLARLNDPMATAARIQTSLAKETSDKLQSLTLGCEEIVASMPIYNSKTRENRKWSATRTQGLGNHITLLTGLLTGIMYSSYEHKSQMLQLTGLTEDVIEATLEAFGNTAFYSRNYDIITEELPANINAIKANIDIINDLLNIQIDTSCITQQRFDIRFEVARLKAQRDANDASQVEAIADKSLTI